MQDNSNEQIPIAPVLIPTKKQKRQGSNKHHWKFFFGWFIGFIFTLLVLGGLILWAANNLNLKKIESMTGADMSALGDEIKEMKIGDLVSKVSDLATNYDEYTFEELCYTHGIIKLENIVTVTGSEGNRTYDYKTIDVTDIIKGKVGKIGDNFKKATDKVTLAQLETAFGVTLPDLILINNVKNSTLVTLGDALSNIKNTYTLSDMANDFNMDLDSSDILKNLKNNTLVSLPEEIDNMTVEELVGTEKVTGNKIVEAIRNITIGNLPDELPKLTVNKILGITTSDNPVLKAIGTSTLEGLETKITNLTFKDLFPAPTGEDTRHAVIRKLAEGNVKVSEVDGKMSEIIDSLTISEVFNLNIEENDLYTTGDPTYKQYKANQGIWALIFAEAGDVTIKNLDDEVTDIMRTAKLGALTWHGVISSTKITISNLESLTLPGSSKLLADCTIVDVIEYVITQAQA